MAHTYRGVWDILPQGRESFGGHLKGVHHKIKVKNMDIIDIKIMFSSLYKTLNVMKEFVGGIYPPMRPGSTPKPPPSYFTKTIVIVLVFSIKSLGRNSQILLT